MKHLTDYQRDDYYKLFLVDTPDPQHNTIGITIDVNYEDEQIEKLKSIAQDYGVPLTKGDVPREIRHILTELIVRIVHPELSIWDVPLFITYYTNIPLFGEGS